MNQLDIDATNQDSIISDLKLAIGGKELNIPSLFEASHDTLEMEEESNDEWPEIIYETYYSGVPVEQIPRRYNKRLCEVQTTISLFKKNLRKIHQNNRRFLNKRIKLDHSKLQIIEDYCTKFRFSALTLGDLKRYLIEKVGGAWNISESTISRALRTKLNMTYKKINKVHPTTASNSNKQKLIEAAAIQIKLSQQGVIWIFIDEFKYSSHTNHCYGWTKRGETGYCRTKPNQFQASFIVAMSSTKIHGITATTKTFNSEKFKYFLRELVSNTKENYALIWDNARIHVSNNIQEFLKEQRLCLITIPAYSPVLNAAEKIILNIKSRIRKNEREGKIVSLVAIRRIIDSISQAELKGWIKASFQDTYNLLTS